MPDTVRTDPEILALLADNSAGQISAQDVRDAYVTIIAHLDTFISADAGNDLTERPKFWIGSQAEYDAILSPDLNTIYTIIPG